MHGLWIDLRSAVRALRNGRLTTAFAVLSLALVIAGNTTLFGVGSAILFRPLPFDAPERLAMVDERERENAALETFRASAANFLDWRERSQVMDDMAGFMPGRLSLGEGEIPEPLKSARVTPNFFDVLGVVPQAGRTFEIDEGRPGGSRPVLLSHELWQQRFAAGEVLGRQLKLNGEAHTVIGVLPADFEFLLPGIEVWLPLQLNPALADTLEMPRDRRDLMVVGRLRHGVDMRQARADFARLAEQLEKEHPAANRDFVVGMTNLRSEYPDNRTRLLFAMMQAVLFFVLLIACANISNLLLARSEARRGEIAMRSVLGAGRLRILRQLLTESLLLAGLGGAFGLVFGKIGIDAVARALGHLLPTYWTPQLDARVVAFNFGLVALAGGLFGLIPSLQSWSTDLAQSLREGARNMPSKRLLSRGLVVAEIALTLVLLCSATMLAKTFVLFRALEPGYSADPRRLLNVELSVPPAYDAATAADRLDAVAEGLAALPGVTRASVVSAPPQSPFITTDAVTLDHRPPAAGEAAHAFWITASPDFPETIAAAVHQGRFFTAGDRAGAEPVAVINLAMAERWWPESSPIGDRLTLLGTSRRIVGVMADVRQSLADLKRVSPVVYLPAAQKPLDDVTVLIAVDSDASALAPAVRKTLSAIDPRLTVGEVRTQHDFVEQWFAGVNVLNGIMGSFGLLAVFLAAIGTYGVMAQAVVRRSREIGIRMALGARPNQVAGMITRQSLAMALIGLAVGAPLASAAVRLVAAVFSEVMPVEPVAVWGFAAMLVLVTLAAGYLPARHAATVNPIEALHHD